MVSPAIKQPIFMEMKPKKTFLHLRSLISMLSDWVSFPAYPNLFGIKGFVVVVVGWYMDWALFCTWLAHI
jgi:hypothetical protein